MHNSLDQALGRQPRLNRVGQSLLNIASGASAAYSLRSLTGGDPKVVRVRRASDNHEQDFTASGVSSGALVDFVNADGTQFMNFDGTDDDITTPALLPATDDFTLTITAFIESTPSSPMGIFGSAAAGTGRHVVQLNTDGTVQFFSENLGGAAITTATIIEKSINTIVLTRTGQTFEITLNGGGAASRTGSSVVLTTGNNNIGDPYFGDNFQGVITSLSVASTTWDGTIANVPAGSTVNGSPSTNALNDGFVTIWYDQSGNSKNATQTTDDNQPLIVEGGSLIDNGKSFSGDGTTFMTMGSTVTVTDEFSVFYKCDLSARSTIIGPSSGTAPRIEHVSSSFIRFADGQNNDYTSISDVFSDAVFSLVRESNDDQPLYINGTLKQTLSNPTPSSLSFRKLFATNITAQLNGNFSEFIIYDSDLGDTTREALEDNMKSYYEIS
jgi:hypothetical protein